jgi:K+ transporter
MYLAMAYGLAITTALMILALVWLGWENRRNEARAAKALV